MDRQIKGGEKDSYAISLRQGEYLQVLIEQQGVNVVATLSNGAGIKLLKVNLSGAVGREPISYLASESGEYQLEVETFQARVTTGNYALSILVKGQILAADELRLSAERLTVEANELLVINDSAQLPRAKELALQALDQWRKLDDKYWLAYLLNQLGSIHHNLGSRAKALEAFNESLSIAKSVADREGEAAALYMTATLYSAPGELRTAQTYFKRALELFKTAGDHERVSYTLDDIGRSYHDLGDTAEALKYYRRALTLAREHGYTRQEAVVLTDIAIVYAKRNQSQKAFQYYKESLSFWQMVDNKTEEAVTLANIALEYSNIHDYEKALSYYTQALAIYKSLNSNYGQSQTLKSIAEIYLSLDNKQKAIELFQQSSALEHTRGDVRAEADTLRRLGKVYDDLEKYEEELRSNLQALPLSQSVGDRQGEAETLSGIADAYAALEKPQEALKYYEQALPMWKDLKNRKREADTLRHIGGMNFALDKPKALQPLKDALVIYESLGDRSNAGLVVAMLGLTNYLIGERETAWKYFNDTLSYLKYADDQSEFEDLINFPMALMLVEDYQSLVNYYQRVATFGKGRSNRWIKALSLSNLGQIYSLTDQSSEAVRSFQQALSVFQAIGDRKGEAATLRNIGKSILQLAATEQFQENVRLANSYFQKALTLHRAERNRSGEGVTLISIGHGHQMLGDNQAAFDDFSRALLLLKEGPDSAEQGGLLYSLMDVCTDLSNHELAILFGKQAVNQLQSMRSKMKQLDKSLEQGFVRLTTDVYRELATLLIKEGRLNEAEQVLGMLKEEEFFRFVRRDDKVANELLKRMNLSPAEKAALERYDKIAERIVALGDEYSTLETQRLRLPLKKTTAIIARQDVLKKDLAAARVVLSLFLEELTKEFGDRDKRVAAVEEGLPADVKSWNEPHTVVVSIIVGKNSLSMILTTTGTQRPFIIDTIAGKPFSEERLNALIVEFRSALKDPATDPRPAGQALYDLLIKPLEEDLQAAGADTIVWSLDGNLRYIPMSALYDAEHGYLAERYATVIITLASRSVLDLPPTEQSRWQALGLGVSKSVGGFPALGHVPEELRAIVRDVDQKERTGLLKGHRLLDEEFTLAAFNLHLGRYNIIHAATHFSFRASTREESLESFLLLGSGEKLTLAQVKDAGPMFSGVELLVLSACETASGGKGADGREVEGFGALAQKAGARSVMATLWPVADPSTRELMVKFYELHGTAPEITKAEALRKAQMALLRGETDNQAPGLRTTRLRRAQVGERLSDGSLPSQSIQPYGHPYYWAPFILIGNWK